jgi:uncharacterized protein YoxC
MADTITIRAEMIDDVSAPAERIKSEVKALGESVKTATSNVGDGAAKAVDDIGVSARTTSGHVTTAGKSIEDMHTKSAAAAKGGVNDLSKGLKGMSEESNRLVERVNKLGDSIEDHLRYPLRSLYYTVEGLTVGMIALGFATANSMAQSVNAITAYTGSASLAASETRALYALSSPESMGALTSQFGQLTGHGATTTQANAAIAAAANISGMTGTGPAGAAQITGALSSIYASGSRVLTAQDYNALQAGGMGGSGPSSILGIIASATGMTPAAITMMMQQGGALAMTPGIMNAILNADPKGLAAERATPAGALEEIKKGITGALSAVITPFIPALDHMSESVSSWGDKVMETAKGTGAGSVAAIGKDWSSGNMGKLGGDLAVLLQAKPNSELAQFLGLVASDIRDIGTIFTHSVIPAMKDAAPLFKAFSDILGLMAEHSTIVKDAIVGLALVIGAAKFLNALMAFEKFIKALKELESIKAIAKLAGMCAACSGGAGEGGLARDAEGAAEGETTAAGGAGILGWLKRTLGIGGGAAGAEAGGEAAAEAGGVAIGGASVGTIAAAAVAAIGSIFVSDKLNAYANKHPYTPAGLAARVGSSTLDPYLEGQKFVWQHFQDLNLDSKMSTAARDTLGAGEAAGRFVGRIGGDVSHWATHANVKSGLESAAKDVGHFATHDVGHFFGGLFGHHHHASDPTTRPIAISGGVNITISGAGDPKRVANEIPRAIGKQIDAHVAMRQRRGAPGTPLPTTPSIQAPAA